MSAADLRAGYAIAGGGQANVIDLTTAASKVVTHQLEQDELTRTRQEAFDKARADFKTKMSDTYDTYVYEDNFDDTGILNLDQAGEKLRGSIKSQYLQTEYEYSQGLIDEAEVRRRNNNLKGQVNEFANLTGDIIAWGEKKDLLEAEGKGNVVNDIRGDLLAAYGDSFKIESGANGLSMQTIIKDPKTGEDKVISVPGSKFTNLMKTDQAVDIETDLDELVTLGGFKEILKGRGFNAKKITDYTRGKEGRSLIKTRVDQWSVAETIDYAVKRGLIDQEDVGVDVIFGEEVQPDLKDKVITSMTEELENRLIFKEKEETYNDAFALQAMRAESAKSLKEEPPKIRMADQEATDAITGDKQRLRTWTTTVDGGIPMNFLVADPGGNMTPEFFNSIQAKRGNIPIPAEAVDAYYLQERIDIDNGIIEIDMGYNYEVEDDDDYINSLMAMSPSQRQAEMKRIGNGQDPGMSTTRDDVVAWVGRMAPKKGKGTFQYTPPNVNEYNKIIARIDPTGKVRKLMSNADWTRYLKAKKRRQQAEEGGGRWAGKSKTNQ